MLNPLEKAPRYFSITTAWMESEEECKDGKELVGPVQEHVRRGHIIFERYLAIWQALLETTNSIIMRCHPSTPMRK